MPVRRDTRPDTAHPVFGADPSGPAPAGGAQRLVSNPSFLVADGRRDGPLGPRYLTPEKFDTFRRIKELVESGLNPAQAVVGVEDSMPPVQPMAPNLGTPPDPREEEAQVFTPTEAKRDVDPPSAPVEDPTGEKPLGVDDFTPMHLMAMTGAESRVAMARSDNQWVKSILGRASESRRVFFEKNRCKPIVWDNLLTSYQITQDVLVWTKPKEIWATFRTMTADDEVLVRQVVDNHYSSSGKQQEIGHMLTAVAGGVESVGGIRLPPINLSMKSEERVKTMLSRVERISRFPHALIVDLAINYTWFVMRVAQAQMDGEVGNG